MKENLESHKSLLETSNAKQESISHARRAGDILARLMQENQEKLPSVEDAARAMQADLSQGVTDKVRIQFELQRLELLYRLWQPRLPDEKKIPREVLKWITEAKELIEQNKIGKAKVLLQDVVQIMEKYESL